MVITHQAIHQVRCHLGSSAGRRSKVIHCRPTGPELVASRPTQLSTTTLCRHRLTPLPICGTMTTRGRRALNLAAGSQLLGDTTMDAKGAIQNIIDMSSMICMSYVEDLTDADLLRRPSPGCN